jgi:hypothetical protein
MVCLCHIINLHSLSLKKKKKKQLLLYDAIAELQFINELASSHAQGFEST